MKYNAKDINYDGCDPVIACFLKEGQSILCDCSNKLGSETTREYVIAYWKGAEAPYLTTNRLFVFASPTTKKRKAKTFVEIAQWLDDNNYVCNGKGEWEWVSDQHFKMPTYPMYLFCYCGREIPEGAFFPEEWLVE